MHQHHKYHTGKISHISEYCPLDLYSMQPHRVERALIHMMATPQNNFKVFVDGVPLCLDPTTEVSPLCSFFGAQDKKDVATILAQILIEDGVLSKLRQWQKHLDSGGISVVYRDYQSLDEDQRALLDMHRESHMNQDLSGSFSAHPVDKLTAIRNFLLSMSLRDCSIMVLLTKADAHAQSSFMYNHQTFKTQIKVIDTDPKHHSKIPYYYDLDQSILNHFSSIIYDRNPCDD
jgi:inositol-pentakisphosphate 2-kinase